MGKEGYPSKMAAFHGNGCPYNNFPDAHSPYDGRPRYSGSAGKEHDNVFDGTIQDFERLPNVNQQRPVSRDADLESRSVAPEVSVTEGGRLHT